MPEFKSVELGFIRCFTQLKTFSRERTPAKLFRPKVLQQLLTVGTFINDSTHPILG